MKSEPVSFQSLINARPLSALQITVFAICFLIAALDGFDVAIIGFLAPAISKSFHATPAQLAPLFAAGQFGSVFGALFAGPIADLLGRKKLMLLCTFWFALCMIVSASVSDLQTFTLLRFLTGIGLGGALPCATALTVEYCPERKRAALTTSMFCGFTFGSAIGGFITAWAVPQFGWRSVILGAGIAPMILVPIAIIITPESVQYLLRRGNFAKIAAILNRTAPNSGLETSQLARPAERKAKPIATLFKARSIFAIATLWIASFMALFVVYLLSSWMPLFLTEQGFDLRTAALVTAMFQFGGTAGAIVIGMMMDRYQPEKVLATAFACAAFCVVAIGSFPASSIILAVLIFAAGFSISGGQTGVMAYAAAWFPNDSKATGLSWTSASGRFGSIVGSFAGGGLVAMGLSFPIILSGLAIPAFLAAICISFKRSS